MWFSIFSLVTKVTKHVLVCVAPLQHKIRTKCRGYFYKNAPGFSESLRGVQGRPSCSSIYNKEFRILVFYDRAQVTEQLQNVTILLTYSPDGVQLCGHLCGIFLHHYLEWTVGLDLHHLDGLPVSALNLKLDQSVVLYFLDCFLRFQMGSFTMVNLWSR